MKKYFLAITAVSLIILAGCQNDPNQNPYLENETEQTSGQGSIESIPSPQNAPIPTEEIELEQENPPATSENQTENQTQASQESQTVEKNGIKVEGNVDPNFEVKKVTQEQ